MKKPGKFLLLNVGVFRLHVIVTWETDASDIMAYAKGHKLKLSKEWEQKFNENMDADILGLCIRLDGPDVLVWMKDRPTDATSYGTLYHELYHAVDAISDSRSLSEDIEARAYTFEYLATEANKFFWK